MEESWLKAKEVRRWLKIEWSDLWQCKHNDELKAEGIAVKDYSLLFVDRGEVIHAIRDYKPLSFREILEKNVGSEYASRVDLDPHVGGWRKFAKQNFPSKTGRRHKAESTRAAGIKYDLSQQQRKGGKGWLNKAKILKKKKYNERM